MVVAVVVVVEFWNSALILSVITSKKTLDVLMDVLRESSTFVMLGTTDWFVKIKLVVTPTEPDQKLMMMHLRKIPGYTFLYPRFNSVVTFKAKVK